VEIITLEKGDGKVLLNGKETAMRYSEAFGLRFESHRDGFQTTYVVSDSDVIDSILMHDLEYPPKSIKEMYRELGCK